MSRNLRQPRGVGVVTRPTTAYRRVCRWPLFPHNRGGVYLKGCGHRQSAMDSQSAALHLYQPQPLYSLFAQKGAAFEHVAVGCRVLAGDHWGRCRALQVEAADGEVDEGRQGREFNAVQRDRRLRVNWGIHAAPAKWGKEAVGGQGKSRDVPTNLSNSHPHTWKPGEISSAGFLRTRTIKHVCHLVQKL